MKAAAAAREAAKVAVTLATWGGGQNFLGARWVERLLDRSPACFKEDLALRLLSLSPHYFFSRDIRVEAERNRHSRTVLVDALVVPYLTPSARVLDYGCGPGYMAHATARRVDHVDAVDVSAGALACAKVLNGRPNITYLKPDELKRRPQVDLAYSYAVFQHLSHESLTRALHLIAGQIRPDGVLLLHFAVPGQQGWRTEAEWREDRSLAGRMKLRYGLNCFGRTVAEMEELIFRGGFTDITTRPLDGTITVPGDDDIVHQHLLTARRR